MQANQPGVGEYLLRHALLFSGTMNGGDSLQYIFKISLAVGSVKNKIIYMMMKHTSMILLIFFERSS